MEIAYTGSKRIPDVRKGTEASLFVLGSFGRVLFQHSAHADLLDMYVKLFSET